MTIEELIAKYEREIIHLTTLGLGHTTALTLKQLNRLNDLKEVVKDLRALQSEPTEPLFGAEPWDCSKSYKDGSYVVEDANGNELCMMFRPDYPDSTVDRIARLITHAPEYRRIALALRDNDSNGSIATEKRLKAREELDKLEAEVLNSQT